MSMQSEMRDRDRASQSSAGDSLVDTKVAAKLLGLRNHHTLEVWRATNAHPELRFYRIGRAVRYSTSDLLTFLATNAVGNGSSLAVTHQALSASFRVRHHG